MGKSLVIVESPAKAKTINKFLGPDYIVKPTGGHIIDLPPKEFGIDIDHGFEPKYDVIKGKSRVLQELKKTAGEVETVLLATDPDREGEAIAWHVANRVVKKGQPHFRVLINQITRDAVVRAVENKGHLDMRKVNAQQARRILDRLVGYKVSPVLWKTLYPGLSAGRVQSVALRLIVERDAEIAAFVPEEYWEIKARLSTARGEEFDAKLVRRNGKPVKISGADEAEKIVGELSSAAFGVRDISEKKTKGSPAPPFITSTLQQDAARRLGFTVSRTMRTAQNLYEGVELAEESVGLITYMRTDSTRTAPEAIEEVRSFIAAKWGASELPGKPNIYRMKKGAQDAHEAIRPASMTLPPSEVKSHLTPDQFKLYTLIWNRFVASQMKPSESTVTTVDITAGGHPDVSGTLHIGDPAEYEFRATATRLDYKGYLAVYEELRPEDDTDEQGAALPKGLKKGEPLALKGLAPSQHFTKPPARYNEAALVKELETLGIGRPSTYAQIIHTILEREYVRREKSKLLSTDLGRDVNRLLVHGFPDLFNVDFTANMEEELDKVESGEEEWLRVVADFYQPFAKSLELFTGQTRELKKSMIEETDELCERCGKPMVIRWGRNGRFMACSGFPACRNTRPIPNPQLVEHPDVIGVKCPVEGCDGVITQKRSKKGRVFYGCSRYPACKFASWERPAALSCPACGSPTVIERKNGGCVCPRCKHAFEIVEK